MKKGNDCIEILEIQDERIWIHSNDLGYGHWIFNSELEALLLKKTKDLKNRNTKKGDE